MEVKSTLDNETLLVSIKGDLDASGAINLDNVIQTALKEQQYRILVDCQNLDYISSAGLGVFISHIDLMKKHAGKFVFYNMNDRVLNVFKILGLEKVMPIVQNYEAAKQAVNEN